MSDAKEKLHMAHHVLMMLRKKQKNNTNIQGDTHAKKRMKERKKMKVFV